MFTVCLPLETLPHVFVRIIAKAKLPCLPILQGLAVGKDKDPQVCPAGQAAMCACMCMCVRAFA